MSGPRRRGGPWRWLRWLIAAVLLGTSGIQAAAHGGQALEEWLILALAIVVLLTVIELIWRRGGRVGRGVLLGLLGAFLGTILSVGRERGRST